MLADEMTKRIYGISKQENRDDLVFYADEDEDHCLGELARLMTLSALYEEREEYEKCHLVNKHIKKLEKIVENL